MIYSAEGVQPGLAKIEVLDYISPPENKSELISFLCMMQSNADFIANFAKKSAMLHEMTKGKSRFEWQISHQKYFDKLISAFKKDALLHCFDLSQPTYVFTDAHISHLGAMLAQVPNVKEARPVAFAS